MSDALLGPALAPLRRPDRETLFVVTGGARGITALCVIRLAQEYRCRFLLLGRTTLDTGEPEWAAGCVEAVELARRAAAALAAGGSKPAPRAVQHAVHSVLAQREVRATLTAVRAAGGQATYLSIDVADGAALRTALFPALLQAQAAQADRPSLGIIHGAGTLSDKLVERKTEHDFDSVFAAKVTGLANLLDCIPLDRLQYLVLFSSAAGFYGNPGQTDYALANEVLNRAAYAAKRSHPACRVIALDWGAWDGGMVTPTLKKHFRQRGIEVITPGAGAQVLVDALGSRREAVQVVVGTPMTAAPAPRAPEPRFCVVRRRLLLGANPFLVDHCIDGRAVLPMVCAVSWMATTCEQLHAGYRFFAVDDARVLKGIVFDGLEEEYVLDVESLPGSAVAGAAADSVVCTTSIWSQSAAGPRRNHYAARLTLRCELPEQPHFDQYLTAEDATALDGAALYRDGTLFNGPRFRGVERVLNVSPSRLTLRATTAPVSERDQGQFPASPFNYFAADSVFQAHLIWARLHYGAGSLPYAAGRGEQFRPLPFGVPLFVTLEVRSHSAFKLVADTYVHDAQGRLLLRVTGSESTISPQLNRLFASVSAAAPAALAAGDPAEAIAPALSPSRATVPLR